MKNIFRDRITAFEIIDSALGILGIAFLLLAALYVQVFFKEQPCPLCLLQRAALANIGLCLLLNFRFGNRMSHWACVIFSGLAGIAVSVRQILLHITSTEGFGMAFMGIHMYTWCFIAFAVAIVGSTFMILIYPEQNYPIK